MKRALKIFGITLGSTIGFILLVLAVALWVLFTPARLTPIVRDVANHYVKCEHEIGKVELTFFSTFPHFGLAVDSVLLVNAVDGAANDTLLAAPKLVAAVDVAGLMQKKLHVSELLLSDVQANIFVDSLGASNLDVFNLPSDTTAEDTSAFSLPFQEIRVDELCVSAKSLHVLSLCDSIDATISGMAFHMRVESWSDMYMQLTLAAVDENRKPIPGTEEYIACDTLLLSVGLLPENELTKAVGIELDPVTGGPVVFDDFSTSLPGVFACGNVLHVHDLVDFVSREAERAGECAAEYATGRKPGQREVVLRGRDGVRYTVPQKIRLDTMPSSLTVRFRVSEPMRDRCIAVYCGKRRLLQKKKRVLAPGEMEFVILKKDSIPVGTKELIVCVEEE